MEQTRRLAEKLRDQWLASGFAILPGASDAELSDFEARHGIRLPEELCVYLRVMNGMRPGETDEELIQFLSLDSMAEEMPPELDGQYRELMVAEHCIFARVYVVRVTLEPVSASAVYDPHWGVDAPLFRSFTELLEVYLSNPEEVANRGPLEA